MAINIALFGAFLLIVAVLGFFLWQTLFASKEYGDGQEKSEPAYSEQQTSGENSVRSGATPSSSKKTDDAIAEYTKWLAIFTLFLVLATIGLFISGERNVEVARESANAARRSAEAAKNAVELSDKTAERQLRAYVYIKDATMIHGGDNEVWEADITLRNFGQTPAYEVTSPCSFFPTMKAEKYTFKEPPKDLVLVPSDMGPGQELHILVASDKPVAPADAALFRRGDAVIFVYGSVKYRDAFGHPRFTDFRLKYRPPASFDAAPEGNKSK